MMETARAAHKTTDPVWKQRIMTMFRSGRGL